MLYQYSHLEDYIRKIYDRVGIDSPAGQNMFWIADQLGIGLYLTSGPSESLLWEERYFIFLNHGQSKRRQWQDFGHELCHVLNHEGDQRRMYELFRELQEWQADNFMYHFCVPSFMLHRIRLPPEKPQAASLVAETFNVEYEFAERRLDRYLSKLLPSAGYR